MQENIIISVLLITYNQEKYIRQAIESVLSQKTDYEWELLIGEDNSSDNTSKIVAEYTDYKAENCTVTTIIRDENVGASQNLFDLIKRAKGKYLTVLEGDDYWIGDDRIQFLAEFLESNPEYVAVSHMRERRTSENILLGYDPAKKLIGKKFTLKDFVKGYLYSAMGCMYRNIYAGNADQYEKMFLTARNACDLVMCYSMLFNGDIFIVDKVYGVYRVSSNGTNYCSRTRTIEYANDYIAQNRELMAFYKKSFFKWKIAYLRCNLLFGYVKYHEREERIKYFSSLTASDKAVVLLEMPLFLLNRVKQKLKQKRERRHSIVRTS